MDDLHHQKLIVDTIADALYRVTRQKPDLPAVVARLQAAAQMIEEWALPHDERPAERPRDRRA